MRGVSQTPMTGTKRPLRAGALSKRPRDLQDSRQICWFRGCGGVRMSEPMCLFATFAAYSSISSLHMIAC